MPSLLRQIDGMVSAAAEPIGEAWGRASGNAAKSAMAAAIEEHAVEKCDIWHLLIASDFQLCYRPYGENASQSQYLRRLHRVRKKGSGVREEAA
ncbi:MAG: hypothetical protein ACREF6_16835 [Alphaproteobacteria bacterium]